MLLLGVFDDAGPSTNQAAEAIASELASGCSFDADALRSVSPRRLDEAALWGDWRDPATGGLVRRGSWRTADGRDLIDPLLADPGAARTVSGGWENPEPGCLGQLAYAFSTPPYGFRAEPAEVDALFRSI